MLARRGAPAVVVVHDWYGLLPHVVTLCDRLAAAGFSAHAVDLYDGRSTTDEDEAAQLMYALDGAAARQRLAAVVRDLRRGDVLAPRISAVGYSMGGQLALSAAGSGLFDAVVAYDASLGPDDAPMPCPVQLHLAGVVDFEPADLPQQFVAAVLASGGTAEAHVYEGAEHSFANADAASFDAAAAATAQARAMQFLGGTRPDATSFERRFSC